MSSKKKLIADLLFGVQLIGAVALCGSQFFRLLETTKGQLLSMFLGYQAFLVLHLVLAIGAYRAEPSRITQQTIFVYIMWIVLAGSNAVAILLNGGYKWSQNDTRFVVLAAIGTIVVFAYASLSGIGIKNPMCKGFLAMIFKALPQFVMAFEVIEKGGAGVPTIAVVAGNITIITRIIQVGLAIREAGWERNRTWLFASETVNELSWAAVTVVWVIKL